MSYRDIDKISGYLLLCALERQKALRCAFYLGLYTVFSFLSETFSNPKQIKYNAYNARPFLEHVTRQYTFCVQVRAFKES